MEIPDFFSDMKKLQNYNFDISEIFESKQNCSFFIEKLSVPGDTKQICENYFKSILYGYNHVFIQKILSRIGFSQNICLPLLHKWEKTPKIDNLLIISNPEDAQRIAKKHIKKAPIFKNVLNSSIISTTDNTDWKAQRDKMNLAFLPNTSLQNIFPLSNERAKKSKEYLLLKSDNCRKSINISDFFTNETQAQLQLVMFGFSNEFEKRTNQKIRNAFLGIETEYIDVFCKESLAEVETSDGPLSSLFDSDDIKKNIGNMVLFAFAGHDTTAHTLTWLLYELCKNPKYKKELIKEIDKFWLKFKEPTYESFQELPFMTRCITETLRLWPALANGTYRELEKDDYVIGHDGTQIKIPKGTYCQIINWTRHRNPELWGDDVDTFNPLRKFSDSEMWNNGFGYYHTQSKRFSPFAYSTRNCIGKNFSHLEMRLILLYLFRDFDFTLTNEQEKTVSNTKYLGINTFTLAPKSINKDELLGMYLNVYLRHSKM